MPKQPYNLEFQPRQRRRRDQVLRFLGGFGVIVLLLGVVSLVAARRDGLLDDFLGALRPTETTTEPPEDAWDYTGGALFLLCETDDAKQELRFCALARVDLARRQVHVFPLSPQAMAPAETGEISLEQALRDGGPKALKDAVEALTEGTVDRYIVSGDSGFIRAVNLLRDSTKRSVTVRLEEGVDYNDQAGLSLRLAKGDNPLTGDSLLRYFRYLGTLGEESVPAQGELLARVLETYLTTEIDTQKQEALFNGLMNILQTDISVSDFYTRRDLLAAIPAHGFTVDVKE